MKQKISKLKRRWKKARPGSVLILVIALLVLLALIGTAYLSSTQTERYSAQQNSVNTEADLLVQGLIDATQSTIANGLFASTSTGVQYRPPSQESITWVLSSMGVLTPTAPPASTGYSNSDSGSIDPFLAERHPVNYSTNAASPSPYWNAISWPLFTDGSGAYSFDSPFDGSATLFLASNKAQLQSYPTYKFVNNQTYPGMIYYMAPSASSIQGSGITQTSGDCTLIQVKSSDTTVVTGVTLQSPTGPLYVQNSTYGVYITPLGLELATSFNQTIPSTWVNFAGNASGDGVADGGMFKLPVGQINNITYYASYRVIDNNSAVNVSSAWTSSTDPAITNIAEPLPQYNATTPTNINNGFFQSNIGLREMLQTGSVSNEMNALNAYRFNGILPTTGSPATPTLSNQPIEDETGTAISRPDFNWLTGGDALSHQLTARAYNPGYSNMQAAQRFNWLGQSASAALAYHFDLRNPNSSASLIEQMLPAETYNNVQTTAYAPAQTTQWYNTLFNPTPAAGSVSQSTPYPLFSGTPQVRTMLTGDNGTSNAIPSRLGNSSASTPVTYNPGNPYYFGDWVTSGGYSYVCLVPNTGQSPPIGYQLPPVSQQANAAPPEYWTQVPWTNQPVKASLNTATFGQLWIAFCQAMTDSVTPITSGTNTVPLWQPPMMSVVQGQNYNEKQLQMFRSPIRDVRSLPIANNTASAATTNTGNPVKSPTSATRVQLTPTQVMQLRAAIAAINVQSMRNYQADATTPANRLVRSHTITLTDNNGSAAYNVEVFGNDIQPFIGQAYVQVYTGQQYPADQNPAGLDVTTLIAIQLLNPYPVAITINGNWGFGTINRANYNNYVAGGAAPLQLTPIPGATGSIPASGIVIPKATASGPGSVVIYDLDHPYDTNPQDNVPYPFPMPAAGSTTAVRVNGLINAIGKELVILKPRKFDNTFSQQSSAADSYNEGPTRMYELVPVDQLDMTGVDTYAKKYNNQNLSYFVYRRATGNVKTATGGSYAWNFTWPGFYAPYNNTYNTTAATGVLTIPLSAPLVQPVQTVQPSTYPNYPFNQPIVYLSTAPAANSMTLTNLTSGQSDPTGANLNAPTYNTITLQLNNTGFPGPNPIAGFSGNVFPFGGFARNADLLQVPYIGAYRIGPPVTGSQYFYEMNSVTMDSSLANDSTLQDNKALASGSQTGPAVYTTLYPGTGKVLPSTAGYMVSPVTVAADSVSDPFVEQIGRFCPVGDPNGSGPMQQMDFGTGNDATNPGTGSYWHYHWTRRVFNYFTVEAPHDDYFPNVDPAGPDITASTNIPAKYPGNTGNIGSTNVLPVNNTQSIQYGQTGYYANANYQYKSEDTTGVQGLININTAPWPVLATLPFVQPGTDLITYYLLNQPSALNPLPTYPGTPTAQPNGYNDNIDLAKAIVDYRNANGPFKSIMDLYKVPAFRVEQELLLANSATSQMPLGYFTGGLSDTSTLTSVNTGAIPANAPTFDFEQRFLLLNRVSNLITTRSDSFTCYVLLQGWRNAGTGNPTLAVERRAAFSIDRTNVTPGNNKPIYYKIPNQ